MSNKHLNSIINEDYLIIHYSSTNFLHDEINITCISTYNSRDNEKKTFPNDIDGSENDLLYEFITYIKKIKINNIITWNMNWDKDFYSLNIINQGLKRYEFDELKRSDYQVYDLDEYYFDQLYNIDKYKGRYGYLRNLAEHNNIIDERNDHYLLDGKVEALLATGSDYRRRIRTSSNTKSHIIRKLIEKIKNNTISLYSTPHSITDIASIYSIKYEINLLNDRNDQIKESGLSPYNLIKKLNSLYFKMIENNIWEKFTKDVTIILESIRKKYLDIEFQEIKKLKMINSKKSIDIDNLRDKYLSYHYNEIKSHLDKLRVDFDNYLSKTGIKILPEEISSLNVSKYKKQIAVIYGRDAVALKHLENILNALGLEMIIFKDVIAATIEEERMASPYVGEIIKRLFRYRGIIVLVTPDEEVKLRDRLRNKEMEKKYLPRPNVVLEMGFALALREDATIIFRIVDSEYEYHEISDNLGKHEIRYDGKSARITSLVDRLRTIGYSIKYDESMFPIKSEYIYK